MKSKSLIARDETSWTPIYLTLFCFSVSLVPVFLSVKQIWIELMLVLHVKTKSCVIHYKINKVCFYNKNCCI